MPNDLRANQQLRINDKITANNGKTTLNMQSDGTDL